MNSALNVVRGGLAGLDEAAGNSQGAGSTLKRLISASVTPRQPICVPRLLHMDSRSGDSSGSFRP